jgi:hypothetical protein
VFRRRLRDYPSPEELATMYAKPHDHRIYGYGHDLRVRHTIALGEWLRDTVKAKTIADLSTGNAAIPNGLFQPGMKLILGDFAPGYEHHGPIEETLKALPMGLDMFVISETIEHVDNPQHLLSRIRQQARSLLLSTPIGEDDLGNPEHVWGWDQEAVGEMLRMAGWNSMARVDVVLQDTYSYQIWACA